MMATMYTRTPTDSYPTSTSKSQAETEEILLTHLPSAPNSNSDPAAAATLTKKPHLEFLIRNLIQGLPARYISQDASQPWLLYWSLQSFSVLQVGIDPGNKQRAIDTLMSFQNTDEGGFGGGPGQGAHLLPTYAAVCALAIVGRSGPGGGWDEIDREKMYLFFMSLKQPDASFTVSKHGEVDVRGIYCLIVVAILLNILTPELISGTPEFLASCQTYEGGFASSSFPFYTPSDDDNGEKPTLLPSPRPPLGEAHGGYTFCAVASWLLLRPFIERERAHQGNAKTLTPEANINMKLLKRWLVQMQGLPSELGGFKGRTNKLVDGCYSWWVGGCFALLEGLELNPHEHHEVHHEVHDEQGLEDEWVDEEDLDMWNSEALQEYILYAGQHPAGGLRDKPPKSADSYHTLYCLAGLSTAQHRVAPDAVYKRALEGVWVDKPEKAKNISGERKYDAAVLAELRKEVYTSALCWNEIGSGNGKAKRKILGGDGNRVNATHPLFNLTVTHTEGMMAYFYGQDVVPPRPGPAPGTKKRSS